MYTLQSNNIASLYYEALNLIMYEGTETHPRGFDCLELSPISMTLTEPWKNILLNPNRKLNVAYAAAEFLWIIYGRDDVDYISRFNSKIADYSDDGKTFFGAYGIPYAQQEEYVLKTLKEDPWSRQAIMTIWRPNPPKTKDIPCTIALHFIRRPLDKLNLIVYMRSNDIWLGLPYDIHTFTCIQMYIADQLNIDIGTYTQVDGSLHAYSNDFLKLPKYLHSGVNIKPDYQESEIGCLLEQKEHICAEYLRRKNVL